MIQEREVERFESKKPLKLNFRLITATNTDLKKLAGEGKFRFDFFFHLSKAILSHPPLRERREDILIYISYFLKILNRNFIKRIKSISEDALNILSQYHWPGNVRELSNILEKSFYNVGDAEVPLQDHLPQNLKENISVFHQRKIERSLRKVVQEIEKENILEALEYYEGNKRKTAS